MHEGIDHFPERTCQAANGRLIMEASGSCKEKLGPFYGEDGTLILRFSTQMFINSQKSDVSSSIHESLPLPIFRVRFSHL